MTQVRDQAVMAGLNKRPPTKDEIDSAAHAATAIAVALDIDGGLRVSGEDGGQLHIAQAVGELIIELLGHVASGNMVTLVPVGTMLTTQEAADMLNVSRPHLTKLLKAGKIDFETVGNHRRVPLPALMSFRDAQRASRREGLDELAQLGQDYDHG